MHNILFFCYGNLRRTVNVQLPAFVIYKSEDGNVSVDVVLKNETIWSTQKGMAELFDVNVPAISKHLDNIFTDEELIYSSTVSKWKKERQLRS